MANNPQDNESAPYWAALAKGSLEGFHPHFAGVDTPQSDQQAQEIQQRQQALGIAPNPSAVRPQGVNPGQYAPPAPTDYEHLRQLSDQSALMQGFASMKAMPTVGNLNPQAVGDGVLSSYVKGRNDAEIRQAQQAQQSQQSQRDLYNRLLETSQNQASQQSAIGASHDIEQHQADLTTRTNVAGMSAKAKADGLQLQLLLGEDRNKIAQGRLGVQQGRLGLQQGNQGLKAATSLAALQTKAGTAYQGSVAADSALKALDQPTGSQDLVNGVQDLFGSRMGSWAQSAVGDITSRADIAAFNAHLAQHAGALGLDPTRFQVGHGDNEDTARKKISDYTGEMQNILDSVKLERGNILNMSANPLISVPPPEVAGKTTAPVAAKPAADWVP